jgi:hypothetical protein
MKKGPSNQKKRAETRRKKRLKKKLKRLSVKQRLSRMTKERRSLAELIAALNKFPPSMTKTVEPEPEDYPHLLKLGQSPLNATLNGQNSPQEIVRQQLQASKKLTRTASGSPLQWPTSLRVEAAIARRAAIFLCEAPRQQIGRLTYIGGPGVPPSEGKPRAATRLRALFQSLMTPSVLLAGAKRIFSSSSTFMQSVEKGVHREGPLLPPLSFGDPERSQKVSYRTVLGNALLKRINLAKLADNPPREKQLSSNAIKGDIGHKQLVFKEHLREEPRQATEDSFYVLGAEQDSFDDEESIGKEKFGVEEESAEVIEVSPLTPLSSGDPAISRRGSDRTAPNNAPLKLVNLAKLADNSPGAEQGSPNNKEKKKSRRIFVVEKHPQEASCQATEDFHYGLGAEQDSFDDEKIIGKEKVGVEEESPESIKARQMGSCVSCCIDRVLRGDYLIPEEEGEAKQLIEWCQLLQAIAAQYEYGCDKHSGLSASSSSSPYDSSAGLYAQPMGHYSVTK